MEHRQPSKRDHHSKNGRGQSHRISEHQNTHRDRQKTAYVSRHGDTRKRSNEVKDASHELLELGGDGAYIRNWIAHTHNQNDEEDAAHFRAIQMQFGHPNVNQKSQRGLQGFGHGNFTLEDPPIPKKRRRNSSSDSSLLQPTESAAKLGLPTQGSGGKPVSKEERHASYTQKKRKAETLISEAPASHHPDELFEKRDRHKTREDLYDHRAREKKKIPDEGKQTRKKRERRGDRRKAAKQAGEDLMNNFVSKSVGQDRLTIRPSISFGLFRNGRASSPVRRRGLPDLAFSEMEFLQHSTHLQPAKTAEKVLSKHTGKDKRKTERAHKEMSAFFKSAKKPLEKISSNSGAGRSSTYLSDETPRYNENLGRGDIESPHKVSYARDVPEQAYLGFGRLGPSAHKPSTHDQISLSMDHRGNALDNRSLWSGKATTCVTWSETQRSPTAIIERRPDSLQPTSPAPDSVRRSLETSGILSHTGIILTPQLRGVRKTPFSTNDPLQFEQNLASNGSIRKLESVASGSAASFRDQSCTSSTNQDRILKSKNENWKIRDGQNIRHQATSMSAHETAQNSGNHKVPVRITKQILVEQYDSGLGWHQSGQTKIPKVSRASEGPQEAKSTPVSRVQAAKKARIRRPSTTLPVMRVLENSQPNVRNELVDNGQLPTVSKNLPRNTSLEHPYREYHAQTGLVQSPWPIETRYNSPYHPGRDNESPREQKHYPQVDLRVDSDLSYNGQRIDNTINQNTTTKTDTSISNKNPSILLHQGNWIGRSRRMVPVSNRLSPILESEPLYLNQMKQEITPQPVFPQYVEDTGDNSQTHCFGRAMLVTENLPYLEGPEYEYLVEANENLPSMSGDYVYLDVEELELELEADGFDPSVENYYGNPDEWEQIHQNIHEESGDYGIGYGTVGASNSQERYPVEENGSYSSNAQHELEQRGSDINGLLDGFWRSQTYYR